MTTFIRISSTMAVLCMLSLTGINAQDNSDDVAIGKYVRIFSKVLNEERTLLVSLPPGYEGSNDTYPVLYVLDGTPVSLGEANTAVNCLSMRQPSSFAPQMIIVAIENTDRSRDMIPGSETAPGFLQFITEELFPFINNEFRADGDRRILYGGSDAGLFVVYSLLENPDNFIGYIASSPTICWREQFMVDKLKELQARNISLDKYLYITYGGEDFKEVLDNLKTYLPLIGELKQKGLRLDINLVPDAEHMPYGSLYSGLKQMYDGYGYPDDKRASEGLDSLKAYYERYSRKVGYAVKPPRGTISGVGKTLSIGKKYDESIAVLGYGLQQYPEDRMLTIFLAEAYYLNNNFDLAKEYYFKSKEIMKRSNTQEPLFNTWKEMKGRFE